MIARLSSLGLVTVLFSATFLAYAADAPDAVSAYRLFMDIGTVDISVPTTVEIPVPDAYLERRDFAVLDRTVSTFEPYLFLEKTQETAVSVQAEGATGGTGRMTDNNASTYTEFPLPEDARGTVRIVLTSTAPITSSAITILLDQFVALPKTVEIRVEKDGTEQILIAKRAMEGQTVRFPKTTAKAWIVTLTYGQPLRIAEMQLAQESSAKSTRTLRFLAQPAHEYRVYLDPDRYVRISTGEAGNLSLNENVRVLPAVPSQKNSAYIVADTDGDGIPDLQDNCVQTANAAQEDKDGNGRGDACDDFDRDGLINSKDNCQNAPNRNQTDTDEDGIGDVCDGEESRITERNAWLPWAGMGIAAVVLVTLMATMLKPKAPPR